MAHAWGVRSDLTPAKTLLPAVGEAEAGFLGTVTSGKLPKAKEKPTVASIWGDAGGEDDAGVSYH